MKVLSSIFTKHKLLLVDSIFLILAVVYFLFFVNRGLVLSDEGYYVHYAERIAQGELVYRDFVLQYSPGYFYLLAGLYKIFGVQILVGRFVSLTMCIAIIVATLVLLRQFKIKSIRIHALVILLLTTLTYPLLHVPIVVWVCVLLSVLLSINFIQWNRTNKLSYIIILGCLLAAVLLTKQNLGALFIIVINALVLVGSKKQWKNSIKLLLMLNSVWVLILGFLLGIYYMHAHSFDGIVAMFAMSKQFIDTYIFTYPSLSLFFQPTGIFKLLPYYFPIVYAIYLFFEVVRKNISIDKVSFALLALTGFFGTVYPASDLLHVYPFLGITVVSAVIIFYKRKGFSIIIFLTTVFILLGIYLTFFMQSYRYEGYFLREVTPVNIPNAAAIMVNYEDKSKSNLRILYDFIHKNTKKDDYIFVYPFSPMLYTLLERKNPSGIVQFVLLEAPERAYSEEKVLEDIKQKKVRYIIVVGPYEYDQKVSRFIQKQKIVFITGPYIVFEINSKITK